jgi:hypothetical protein
MIRFVLISGKHGRDLYMSKKWWKSTTIWVNVLMAAVAIADKLGPNVIPVEISAAIVAVVNILNRFRTTEPVK